MAPDFEGKQNGFTIVEMLIVIAISVALSSVFLANHKRFSQDIALSTITYDVALALRQAQVFGQSTRAATEVAAGTFRLRYGVNFSMNTPTEFFIFADRGGTGDEGDGVWNNATDKVVETYTLTGGNKINRLCVVFGGVTTCTPGGFSSLYATFERPFRTTATEPLGAFIKVNGLPLVVYDRAQIEVANSSGRTHTVTVWSSGQISVQ